MGVRGNLWAFKKICGRSGGFAGVQPENLKIAVLPLEAALLFLILYPSDDIQKSG